jgi:small-conductance mechanosensitive channel
LQYYFALEIKKPDFISVVSMSPDAYQKSTEASAFPLPWRLRQLTALLVVVVALLSPTMLFAEPEAQAASWSDKQMTFDIAPIIVDGRKLSNVRGVSAYPAKRRAREIADRIKAFAAEAKLSPDELHVKNTERASSIIGPTGPIWHIFDFDAQFSGIEVDRSVFAETLLLRIRETIHAYRDDRRPEVLLTNAGYAVFLTVLTLSLLFGARWGLRRFSAWVEQRIPEHLETLEARSFNLLRADLVWRIFHRTVKLTSVVAAIFLGFLFVNTVLGLFPWTRLLATRLFDFVLDPLRTIGSDVLDYLPNLGFLVMIVIIFYYVLKMMNALFGAINKERITFSGFDPEWAWPTYRLARLLVLAFGLVLAYPYIPGSDSAAFKGVSIFLGVLLSIGSSSIVSNIVAGYSMTYRRAFKIGDRVRIGQTVGDVIEMRLLVTHLRTLKNEEVVIPNSVILNSEVTNFSSLATDNGLILHTTVGIGYEVPWRQVEAMLLLAAKKTPGLITTRDPFVLPTTLGDFAITYELNAYTDDASGMPSLYRALHCNILDVFNEYGVAIMTPAYERDPEEPKIVPREKWYEAPALSPASKVTL